MRNVGTSQTKYRTPAIAAEAVPKPYHPSTGSRIWGSPIIMIVIALLGAAMVALLTIGLLQPRRSGLPARMAEFVSIRDLQKDKGQVPGAGAATAASAGGSPIAAAPWP